MLTTPMHIPIPFAAFVVSDMLSAAVKCVVSFTVVHSKIPAHAVHSRFSSINNDVSFTVSSNALCLTRVSVRSLTTAFR